VLYIDKEVPTAVDTLQKASIKCIAPDTHNGYIVLRIKVSKMLINFKFLYKLISK